MKPLSYILLLFAGSLTMHASVIYTLDVNLSPIVPGSEMSGSVTLGAPLTPGESTPIVFTFSDPADYSPSPVDGTLTVGSGIGGNTVGFSELTFTDLLNDSTIHLMTRGMATCPTSASDTAGIPCQANGGWEDGDPADYTGTYSVSAASWVTNTVPEPSYSFPLLAVGAVLLWRRAMKRPA
jgi:hypothetical protein